MNYEQNLYLSKPNYIEELQCRSETTSASQAKQPTSNTIQESLFEDQFVNSLLHIESDVRSELNCKNIDGSNSSGQVSQESKANTVTSTEDSCHFHEFQELSNGSLTNLLLAGARAVEASNWPLASNVIAKLTTILLNQEDEENPFNHMVFYLTQALHYKCRSAPELLFHELIPTQKETMSAFQMLQELSPFMKFAQFTANQAILEATQGASVIHVIDLNIMEGIQWPPLMADLALRRDVSMRITAVIGDPQNSALVQQTGRRLTEFAKSVGLHFIFDQIIIEKEEDFNKIEVGHALIANCMIHQLHLPNRNFSFVKTFLSGVSKLSLKMVILVEEELLNFAKVTSQSFLEFFYEAIQHYSALSDSLVHSFTSEGFRTIAREIMGLRILDCVKSFPSQRKEKMLWEDGFSSLKGLEPIPMSATNVSQAKLLVSLFGRGYWVQHEKCRLSLCWNSRPLTTASIWMPRG